MMVNLKVHGTRAIYEFLTKESLSNICIVIVRYFGGILLGAGLLSRTYLKAFKEASMICTKEELYNLIEYSFNIDYSNIDRANNIINEFVKLKKIVNVSIEYNDKICFKVLIKEAEINNFKEKMHEL